MHPSRSAGVRGTARWKGDAGHRGRPVLTGAGNPHVAQAAGRTGVGEGHTTGEAGSCWRRKGPLLLVRFGGSRGSVIGDEPGTPLRIRTLLKKLYPAAKVDADRCCWARLPSPTASATQPELGPRRVPRAETSRKAGCGKSCAVKTAGRIPVADRGSRERCFRVNRLTRR